MNVHNISGHYSVNTYSVDWSNLEYLCKHSSDSYGVFIIGFRMKKIETCECSSHSSEKAVHENKKKDP